MQQTAFLLAGILAACASSQPAPVSYGQGAAQARPPALTPAPDPAPDPAWATGAGTPLSAYALRREPGFDPAHPPRTHRVGAHESLYDIGARYQIPLLALIEQNQLEPPYALAPGREIELPPPNLHVLAPGESFESVARAYNVDLRSLALLNRIAPPYTVREGEPIVLPATARAWNEAPVVAGPISPQVATLSAARFAWPVRGEVLARFGAQPGGRRLDGVEIAARDGEPVLAAGDGEVVYAGQDLPSYGSLILVRHGDGYVTAYAYGRRALVREGQQVRAGEPLAEAGAHQGRIMFQVRRGRAAIDPLALLGAPPGG